MPQDKRRPQSADDDDPFNSPVSRCQAGHATEVTRPGFSKVEGLRAGICEPCGIICALVERINPIWRQGDDPGILEILTRDMIDSERQAHAYSSDSSDPMWTRW